MLIVNPEIRRAETLPAEFYTDERYFFESKEKIFVRTWQFLEVVQSVEKKLTPLVLLEGFLDEPVLLVKDKEDISCLSNVCTHRGKILVEEACDTESIHCGYHGRRFRLDGKFLSMPEFEGVCDFPSRKDDLMKIPLEVWKEMIFVSLDPKFDFKDFFREIEPYISQLRLDIKSVSRKDYLVKAHWALYCENYLEGLHIPFVHKGLNRVLDFLSYTTNTFRFSSLQVGFTDQRECGFDFQIDGFSEKKHIAALYFFVFPNLMFNFYPWGLSVNVVKPLKLDETLVSYITFVSDESKLNVGAGADLDTVEIEDQRVVESVQKGIRSRFFKSGRYSPSREKAVHHFHRLIAEFMNS
ncbi:MAG: aromatic ring-hydroxylating dioxygenase subunit alpha [Pyrinomonadaceae bacterium]|nr:aromatic ring-hydroxylating dioxygenase subunit alpha [Pyrinomonadaceae bacterium]MCX7639910.1 aromatic ring-hydroxylating dioxygenase subunit alpha [Pyrinomonadaceae bacterium]MDW8304082.1 aromatic ring-hydroxylating dioxygenase subunit alpha [Acidobacteriota bacterium]